MQERFRYSSKDVKQLLLPARASAVVFDCDGLLADTEGLWLDAVASCARSLGVVLGRVEQFRGMSIDGAAEVLRASSTTQAGGPRCPPPVIAELLTNDFAARVVREARAMPGALEVVRRVGATLPVAVASNSPRAVLDQVLHGIGLGHLVESSVARDEVAAPKPAPDLYVAAVDKLRVLHPDVSAETAVAFEDSAIGAQSATSAGLFVIGVNADPDVRLSCHDRYRSLDDVTLTTWASDVRKLQEQAAATVPLVLGSYDRSTAVLTVACQYPSDSTARIEVYRQEQCVWDERPHDSPAAAADVAGGSTMMHLDVSGIGMGTFRFFLLVDGRLPEWNGRTGEFVVDEEPVGDRPVVAGAFERPSGDFDVMTWNLWFGGCHVNDGLAKQTAYLREFPHHVLALQECFELHGKRLAQSLGWNIAQQGYDAAVMSPHPVRLHRTATDPFATCATVQLPGGAVTVWSVHLSHSDYGPYTAADAGTRAEFALSSRGERLRAAQLARVLVEQTRLEQDGEVAVDSAVVIAGDFNAPSHLDWNVDRGGGIEWPTSKMLWLAGYDDAFRRVHACVTSVPGHTWSPVIPEADEPRDRIDFVFVRGAAVLDAYSVAATPDAGAPILALRQVGSASHHIGKHLDNDWPTDHAAVVARLACGQGVVHGPAVSIRG